LYVHRIPAEFAAQAHADADGRTRRLYPRFGRWWITRRVPPDCAAVFPCAGPITGKRLLHVDDVLDLGAAVFGLWPHQLSYIGFDGGKYSRTTTTYASKADARRLVLTLACDMTGARAMEVEDAIGCPRQKILRMRRTMLRRNPGFPVRLAALAKVIGELAES